MPSETIVAPPLSRRGAALVDAPISWLMAQALTVPDLLSLAAGFVDQDSLPFAEVAELVAGLGADAEAGRRSLQYGTTAGDLALRETLLARLAARNGAPVWRDVTPDEILVTTGSQQLLYLLAEVLLDPGDVVLVENPSYFVYVGALQSFAARLIGVSCDDLGLLPEALDERLAELSSAGQLDRIKMIYLMPYSQNPTGATLSAERRTELRRVLERWWDRGLRGVLVEDAAYRDLRFPGRADLPPLFEHQSSNERVCYVDSFSKALSPGLRVGFGVVPPALRDPLLRLKSHHDFGSSNFAQQVLLAALRTGLVDRHLARLGARYEAKCAALRDVLTAEVGGAVELVSPSGGLYLWARMPPGIEAGRDSRLFEKALAERVLYVPGEMCSLAEADGAEACRRSMRLCYAYPPDEELVEAGTRLARAMRAVL